MSTNEESATDESLELSDDGSQPEVMPEAASDAAQSDHFKQKWENQRKVNRDLEAKLKKLSEAADLQGKPDAEREIAERVREATDKANRRLVAAEVRAAAVGKVRNPALALKLIDMSEIDVGADGEVDASSVGVAIDSLIEEYPELASTSSKFNGSADQGARGRKSKEAAKPNQNDLLRAAFSGR